MCLNLSREARVSDSGFISLPLVGVPIQVNGLTTAERKKKSPKFCR